MYLVVENDFMDLTVTAIVLREGGLLCSPVPIQRNDRLIKIRILFFIILIFGAFKHIHSGFAFCRNAFTDENFFHGQE